MSTNSFKIKNSAVLTPKDLSTLVSPESGEIACDINDSNKIKRYDAASASWVEVGSGGVGSVDIMFVQDFESASLSSFTQTGLSLSTTNPLHGKVSAVLTHQAAVNQSFKQIIPVDPKFRGQAMVLDLNVKSAASAGNVVIKVRDESNSADLIVSEALQLSNDVSGRRSSVSFTIPSTCSSLSYTITALPEAGSPVTRIDDIVAMLSDVSLLETSVLVPNLTAWQGYTPTFQGFGTPSNVEFEWRQVGENVEIRGKFTSGTPTAVEARVGLPGGLTSAGTDLIPSLQLAGYGAKSPNTAENTSILIEPSVSYFTFGLGWASGSELTKQNASVFSINGYVFSLTASIPCAGLSATSTKTIPLTQSGLVQEGDSYIRLSGSTIDGSLRVTSPTVVTNIGDDFIVDTSAGYVTLKAAQEGVYTITFLADGTSSGLDRQANILLNGVTLSNQRDIGNGAGEGFSLTNTTSRYLLTTDELTFIISGSSARTYNIQASHQGSLKQVSVSSDQKITIPTSELRFEGASARGTGTETGIVQFTSLAKLRGDAFEINNSNGTAITMKKAGKLEVTASVYSSAANISYFVTKNQASRTGIPAATSEIIASGLSITANSAGTGGSIDVKVGDIIRVSSTVNPTALATSNFLNLSFQEQDIAVSVTNTLPQFSESDSSVRLDTANGYGSTANKIRRFSNVRDNIGTDIEYADSATNGASFTVKSAGVYSISYTDQAAAPTYFGLSKNSSQLTTSIVSINTADRLAAGTTANTAAYPDTIAWQGYLQAGDIIRAHNEGSLSSASPERTQFTISKVGKPNVTGVDVTPFVNLDLSNKTTIYSASISAAGAISNENETFISSCSVASNQFTINFKPGVFTVAPNCAITPLDGGANGNMVMILSQSASSIVYKTVRHDSVALATGVNIIVQKQGVDYDPSYEAILTPTETFSTDTASLQYASSSLYNLTTLANAPVGTYITFTYAANTNTRTQTTTRPTQTDADMNANGILVYPRAYNVSSSAAQPAVIAIQIGKGLKGVSIGVYKSSGKITPGSVDAFIQTTTEAGIRIRSYSELTGILTLDHGQRLTTTTISGFEFEDQSFQSSGYLVINASKNPSIVGLGLQTVAAKGVNSSGQSIPNTGANIMLYNASKTYDTNGALNAATGVFTAPENGYYQASWSCLFSMTSNLGQVIVATLYKNGVAHSLGAYNTMDRAVAIDAGSTGSCGLYLAKGDTVDIRITNNRAAGATALAANETYNYFSIHKTSLSTGN